MQRVVVIGAGIIGASIAYHLLQRGVVATVIDRAQPGAAATGSSFAWINATLDNPRPYYALRLQSMLEYRRWEAELEAMPPLHWDGSLFWEDATPSAELERAVREHQRWGYPLRWVDRAQCLQLQPGLASAPERALYASLEGSIDAAALTRALLNMVRNRGGDIRCECHVHRIEQRGADWVVQTDAGAIEAECVVIAAGVDTSALAEPLGVTVPLQSNAGLLVHTKPLPQCLRRIVLAPEVHMRQQPNGIVIAGEDFGGGTGSEDQHAAAERIMVAMRRTIPEFAEAELARVTTAIRPEPEGGMPVVGFGGSRAGVYIAVMHSGVTLAPLIGRLAADEIVDGVHSDLLEPYRPGRFNPGIS